MKFFGDTDNDADFEYMQAILAVRKKLSGAPQQTQTTRPTTPPTPSVKATRQQSLNLASQPNSKVSRELLITNQQVASLMGLRITNIRRNCRNVPGYSKLVKPHPNLRGHWIIGEQLLNEMREEDVLALESGATLRVPRALPTQVINACIGTINPNDPPKYKPQIQSHVKDATVFSFAKTKTNMTYNLTLIDNWLHTQPEWYMAVENYFLKKNYKRP